MFGLCKKMSDSAITNSVVPTALQTMSKTSGRSLGSRFSSLSFIVVVLDRSRRDIVLSKKADFFELLSTRKNYLSGFVIASGRPGRPPPLPKSTTLLLMCGAITKES